MQVPNDILYSIKKRGNTFVVFNKAGQIIGTVAVLFGHRWVIRNMFGLRLGIASKSRWITYEVNKLVEDGKLTLTKAEQVKQMIEHHQGRIVAMQFSRGQIDRDIGKAEEAIQEYKAGEVE